MGTGYTRNDTANNIADGNVINASDLDGEFDAVQAAFNGTTGHSHDGTSGEGPQIAAGGIASNAVTTAKILDANVTTAKIADGNVTTAKILDSNVTTAKIANANVTLAKMAANSIDSDQYVDGSIDRVHLAADIVDGTKIADDSIDSEHYVDGSIDTAHIANDAVTGDKLANNIQIAGTLGVTGETTLTTHLNMGDGDIIKLGASADLQIYHNGSNSYIDDTGTGNLYIRASDSVRLQSATGEQGVLVASNGAVTLYYDNAAKLATKSDGVDITGELQSDSLDVDGTSNFAGNITLQYSTPTIILTDTDANGDAYIFSDGGTSTGSLFLSADHNNELANSTVTLRVDGTDRLVADTSGAYVDGNFRFSDNDKATFGASNDLEIYHDGLNSYIKDVGTGNLLIQGNGAAVVIEDTSGNNNVVAYPNGVTSLSYAGSAKLVTKTDGVDITGELQCDSLDVDGAGNISGTLTMGGDIDMQDSDVLLIGSGDDLRLYHDASNSYIDSNGTGNFYIRQRNNDLDVLIQSDNGSGGEATYFQADGSSGEARLFHYGTQKLNTKSDGVDITGELQCDSLDVDGGANISGTLTMGGNIDLQDNDEILIGSSDDLQLRHDGSNSYIEEIGTGSLFLRGSNLNVQDREGNNFIVMTDNGTGGTVALYQNASLKLNTATDGIYVTGNVQSSTGEFEGASNQDRITIGASNISFIINNSEEFRMESDGDFHADGDVIAYSTTVSDERLKTDIEKIENATDKVSQLNGYTFTYKADGKKSAGVIAQEVEKVLPSAVSEKELPLKMDDGVAYKTVQYDQIIGLLIESIKELKQEINELKGA